MQQSPRRTPLRHRGPTHAHGERIPLHTGARSHRSALAHPLHAEGAPSPSPRTHRALLGEEGDSAPRKRSRSRSRTLGGAPLPLPFPERTPRSSRGSGAAGGALRGGESGGAPLPGRAPRGCHGAAAATSVVPGTTATGPSRPHSAGVRAAAGKRKGREGKEPPPPLPGFSGGCPPPPP